MVMVMIKMMMMMDSCDDDNDNNEDNMDLVKQPCTLWVLVEDWAPARCSWGCGFDYFRGLLLTFTFTLVSCWLIHLFCFVAELWIHHLYSLDKEKNVVEWFGKCETWWNNNEIDFSYVKGVGVRAFFIFEFSKITYKAFVVVFMKWTQKKCEFSYDDNWGINIEKNDKWEALISILNTEMNKEHVGGGKKKKKIWRGRAPKVELLPSRLKCTEIQRIELTCTNTNSSLKTTYKTDGERDRPRYLVRPL